MKKTIFILFFSLISIFGLNSVVFADSSENIRPQIPEEAYKNNSYWFYLNCVAIDTQTEEAYCFDDVYFRINLTSSTDYNYFGFGHTAYGSPSYWSYRYYLNSNTVRSFYEMFSSDTPNISVDFLTGKVYKLSASDTAYSMDELWNYSGLISCVNAVDFDYSVLAHSWVKFINNNQTSSYYHAYVKQVLDGKQIVLDEVSDNNIYYFVLGMSNEAYGNAWNSELMKIMQNRFSSNAKMIQYDSNTFNIDCKKTVGDLLEAGKTIYNIRDCTLIHPSLSDGNVESPSSFNLVVNSEKNYVTAFWYGTNQFGFTRCRMYWHLEVYDLSNTLIATRYTDVTNYDVALNMSSSVNIKTLLKDVGVGDVEHTFDISNYVYKLQLNIQNYEIYNGIIYENGDVYDVWITLDNFETQYFVTKKTTNPSTGVTDDNSEEVVNPNNPENDVTVKDENETSGGGSSSSSNSIIGSGNTYEDSGGLIGSAFTTIADTVTSIAKIPSLIGQLFSFLPTEVTALMLTGIIACIGIAIFKMLM